MKTGDAVKVTATIGGHPDPVGYLVFVDAIDADGIWGNYEVCHLGKSIGPLPHGLFLWDAMQSFEVWHNAATGG